MCKDEILLLMENQSIMKIVISNCGDNMVCVFLIGLDRYALISDSTTV